MSTCAVVDAWEADVPPLQKLVLLALADGVSCDGGLDFDVEPLCVQCSMAEPVLMRVLDGLADSGWIQYHVDGGTMLGRLVGYGEMAA